MDNSRGDPKILYIDIETAPSLGYFFDLWKEGNIVKIVRPWFILSYAWKWEHEKEVHVHALPDYPQYVKSRLDDKPLIKDLWKHLDEADLVIAHNGDRFDLKKIRSRFLKHKLKPTSPFRTIDTLKVMRNYFAEDSNKLDNFAKTHGLGGKLPHQGFKLWDDCIEGILSAWRIMKAYNKQDVVILVKTYKLIRPWMSNHPNLNVYGRTVGCPTCQSSLIRKKGFVYAQSRVYQSWLCNKCGARFKGEVVKK